MLQEKKDSERQSGGCGSCRSCGGVGRFREEHYACLQSQVSRVCMLVTICARDSFCVPTGMPDGIIGDKGEGPVVRAHRGDRKLGVAPQVPLSTSFSTCQQQQSHCSNRKKDEARRGSWGQRSRINRTGLGHRSLRTSKLEVEPALKFGHFNFLLPLQLFLKECFNIAFLRTFH